MRIGVVTTSYPRWPGDPAGSFVEGHVRALRALGHDVEVIAAAPRASRRVELRERERRAQERRMRQTDAHEIDLRERARREGDRRVVRVPSALFYDGGAPDALERDVRGIVDGALFAARLSATVAMRARHWDHVVAHWLPPALASLVARKPMTVIAHGGDVHVLQRLSLLAPAVRALRGARRIYVAEHLRALAGDRDGIVQPMGLDLAHFAGLGRAPATPPIVLFVGRLVPIKGVDTLIEAMAHVDARLVIAGDGPERRALEARARRTRAMFVGAVDTARRDQLLREASVVVVPSRTLANGRIEGCPTIALEALAAGVPVVATIGRANEFVPPDDPHALASAIRRALAGQPPTQHLVADLDWRDVASRLLRT